MTIRLLAGDCRDVLATLPADSVHCCVTSPPYYALRSYLDAGHVDKHREIGSESTPDEYLATMVQVFREVRRVLRPDGTCWVNIGDSYASSGKSTPQDLTERQAEYNNGQRHSRWDLSVRAPTPTGLAAKQLLLMPARLALALQADGWWVRSDIIWHKPNPMPESCTDRPTSAHEHVFLLTKSARYYYDADAVREEAEYGRRDASGSWRGAAYLNQNGAQDNAVTNGVSGSITGKHPETGRSCRNVWTIATHAYPNAHFATFPPELASRCIRAGTSERGVCAQCGAPWRRVVERGAERVMRSANDGKGYVLPKDQSADGLSRYGSGKSGVFVPNAHYETTTTGWSPSCSHGGATVPATVLDPFAGAFTTGLVADRLQRDCIGIELSPDYNAMSRARITDDAPLFAQFPVADPADERMADLFAPLAAD